jgi:hypothetical protein
MGRYLSLRMEIADPRPLPELLGPAFASSFFQPIALGGIASQAAGTSWLLGGYALEDFVGRFTERSHRPAAAVQLVESGDAGERTYLRSIAKQLSSPGVPSKDIPPDALSPFETADPTLGVTYMEPVALGPSALSAAKDWVAKFPRGVLYLYGTLDVANADSAPPLRRAFRSLSESEAQQRMPGAPLLLIRAAEPAGSPGLSEITLFSDSPVWLREGKALGGRVGGPEADQNLARLAGLAEALGWGEGTTKPGGELYLEGSPFTREAPRLERALSSVLASGARDTTK